MEGSEIIVVNKSYMLQEVEISCGEKTEKYTLHPASQLFYVPAGEAHQPRARRR